MQPCCVLRRGRVLSPQEGLQQPGKEARSKDLIITGDVDEIPRGGGGSGAAALRVGQPGGAPQLRGAGGPLLLLQLHQLRGCAHARLTRAPCPWRGAAPTLIGPSWRRIQAWPAIQSRIACRACQCMTEVMAAPSRGQCAPHAVALAPCKAVAMRTLHCAQPVLLAPEGASGGAPLSGEWSAGPKVFEYEGAATMGGLDKNLMRYETKCDLVLKSASWHCTDCFATIAAVKAKISGFSHWEKDRFPYNESTYIVDRCARDPSQVTRMQGTLRQLRSVLLDNACMSCSMAGAHTVLARKPDFPGLLELLGPHANQGSAPAPAAKDTPVR